MKQVTLTVNTSVPDKRDPVSIFHLGQSFFLAGNRCLLSIDVAPDVTQCLVSPGVVNLCFASELFMKAIIVSGGGTPPKTHKLVELSALLPPEILQALRCAYEQSIPDPSYDQLLAEAGEYFVKVRYGFEFNVFAYHEHPLYILASKLHVQVAQLLGQRTGLAAVRV